MALSSDPSIQAGEDYQPFRDPSHVLFGQRDLTIGYPRLDNPFLLDRLVRVAPVHVIGVEGLPQLEASDRSDSAA
jgi:hypothetical protein